MTPRIESFPQTTVVGKHVEMSLNDNRTYALWHSFMPELKLVKGRLNTELISLQIVPVPFKFNPDARFTKWACCAVENSNTIPDSMESFSIPQGLYAVFVHKGAATAAPKTFGDIFGEWIPNSIYDIDSRPHFEILGDKYKNDHPDSEEELWIPIKERK